MSDSMEVMNFISENIMLLLPIVLIYYGIVIYAIVDLYKKDRVVRGEKILWLLVILFVNTFGPILYFLIGRKE